MPRLVLMCGLAGSGKSTYARGLAATGWRRFSVDEELWDLGLRGQDVPADVDERVRSRQRDEIARALRSGEDVVVDHAFFARADRDAYRRLGHDLGADVEVVYLATPLEEIRRRLALRRGAHADDVVVPPELLDRYVAGFEAPGPDEPDVRTVRPTDA